MRAIWVLRDDDVVQRFVRFDGFSVAHQFAVQHAPRHYALLAAESALQLRIELIERDGGQESQAAQIHRKDRDLAAGHRARRRQQRSVAAQYDHQLRALRHLLAGKPVARGLNRRRFRIQPRLNATRVQPSDQFRHDGRRVRDSRLGHDADHFNVWHIRGTPDSLPRRAPETE